MTNDNIEIDKSVDDNFITRTFRVSVFNILRKIFMPLVLSIVVVTIFFGMFSLKSINTKLNEQVQYNTKRFALTEDVQKNRTLIIEMHNRIKELEKLNNISNPGLSNDAGLLVKPPGTP